MMNANTFGSWIGTTAAGADMLPVLQAKEEARTTPHKSVKDGFSILQLGISAPTGTEIEINGEAVRLPSTGVFQLSYGLIELKSLVFKTAVEANIVYVY